MQDSIFSLLSTLCRDKDSSALLVLKQGAEVTIAAHNNGVATTSSINKDRASRQVKNTIASHVISIIFDQNESEE